MKEYEKNPPDDEWLDLVDENDLVIGKQLRSVIYQEGVSNFRVVEAFIRNSQGQLWIPKRTCHKRLYPNAFDFSMGEHVQRGESYEQAFRRGMLEELRLDISSVSYRLLGIVTPHRDGSVAFSHIYEVLSDNTPQYNRQDFSTSFWLSPDELQITIRNGEPAKSHLQLALDRFYKK